jgi:hypothetical protein
VNQLIAIFCDIDDFCKAFHGSDVRGGQRLHWPAVAGQPREGSGTGGVGAIRRTVSTEAIARRLTLTMALTRDMLMHSKELVLTLQRVRA